MRGLNVSRVQPGRAGPEEPMRPLGRIAGIYGRYLVLYLIFGALWVSHGFYGGSGPRGSVCVDSGEPNAGIVRGVIPRSGAYLHAGGDITACALHPSLGQWGLYLLTRLPGIALWGCLLLMIWRLITEASRSGPFTLRAASLSRQLGWVVIAGSIVVGALSHLGADVLTAMLITPPPFGLRGIPVDVLAGGPIRALFPVPALAGAALLTFGRLTQAAAAMDEELKATV